MFYSVDLLLLVVSVLIVNSQSFEQRDLYPNRTITSSRSIYELVQARRMAARIAALANRTRHNNNYNDLISSRNQTNMSHSDSFLKPFIYSKEIHDQLRNEKLIAAILIAVVSLIVAGVLILLFIKVKLASVVSTEIIHQPNSSNNRQTIPEYVPLSQTRFETRNFQRKERRLPTSV